VCNFSLEDDDKQNFQESDEKEESNNTMRKLVADDE